MAEKMYTNTPTGRVELTEEESSEFIKWREEENKRLADTKWIRDRQAEYPSIPDQLDEIYHNGINAWKAIIKQTKDKYPKG
jgi:hypothetical protein